MMNEPIYTIQQPAFEIWSKFHIRPYALHASQTHITPANRNWCISFCTSLRRLFFCFFFALLLTNIDSLTTQSRSMSNWSPAIIRLFAEQVLICNKEKNHCDASITLHSLCVCPARAFHSHKQLWFLSAVHAIDIRQSDFHSASVRNKRRKEKTNLLNRNDTNSVESMLPNQNWKLLQMEMDTPHSYIYNTMLKTELLSVSDLLTRSHYVILWLIFSVLLIE